MPTYAMIEKSTDLNHPNTKVGFTRSLKRATTWRDEPGKSGRFTYSDPGAAQNHHHTFRYVYEMPHGWRRPTKKALAERSSRAGHFSMTCAMAAACEGAGTEVKK